MPTVAFDPLDARRPSPTRTRVRAAAHRGSGARRRRGRRVGEPLRRRGARAARAVVAPAVVTAHRRVRLGRLPIGAMDQAMLQQDPPDHGRIRATLARDFSVRTVQQLRPRIEALVEELVAPGREAGEIEVVHAVAGPLPVLITCAMLGIPPSERGFIEWGSAAMAPLGEATVRPEVAAAGAEAIGAFTVFFRELVAEKRRHPGKDLVTTMVEACDAGTITSGELLGTLVARAVRRARDHHQPHHPRPGAPARRRRAAAPLPNRARRSCPAPSRRCSASTVRSTSCAVGRPRTSSSTTPASPRGRSSCRCWRRPTAIRTSSPSPTGSTSAAPRIGTWPSATAVTSAPARRCRGSKPRSPCPPSSPPCPNARIVEPPQWRPVFGLRGYEALRLAVAG